MGQAFELVVFYLPAQMSRFSSFFEAEAEVSGDDPGFHVSVYLLFRIIFREKEDVHRIAGKLCAGFLHGPGTPPPGIEAVCFLYRIDGFRVSGEQCFGILQNVAKELGIHVVFMRAVFDEQVRLLISYCSEGGLIEVQCIQEPQLGCSRAQPADG